MVNKIVWGCDPSLQYESAWIRSLTNASESHDINPSLYDSLILVESGLLRLNKNINLKHWIIPMVYGKSVYLILYLPISKKTLIHLSDEEVLMVIRSTINYRLTSVYFEISIILDLIVILVFITSQ